ncbi:fungal-specific transcription factor domain-containing protein [Microdochium trichocladiopsis]|uniref:Fungal-specific transcription factor domain-containing protein n=1 Tax=Microdochium trichocladiopsis TaxID=1682393 RepID=A0A9P8YG00_9PEZI|nr:fungal-specific transcription factor domain-containing protein [Microdochium trichocladiopsis]KAH7039575.1 fungal-specific transcription factor domain-containing protein [Microdochium trichocladiopsis]
MERPAVTLHWEATTTPTQFSGSPGSQRNTPRFRRSKTGCRTCRLRRKKCGEQRPVCEGCRRNHLLCSWPGRPAPEEESGVPDGPGMHALAAIAARPGPRQTAAPASMASLPTVSNFVHRWNEIGSLDEVGKAKVLLQHYICSTASRLTTGKGNNPYLSLVLPFAEQHWDILHALLAISASHLSYTDPAYAYPTKSHYAVALRAAKNHVTTVGRGQHDEAIRLLVLLVLLCHFEVVDGDMRGAIQFHLAACRHLLQLVYDSLHLQNKDIVAFIAEQYLYFNAVAYNVRLDETGLASIVPATEDLDQDEFYPLLSGSSVSGFLFGTSVDLFRLIPSVVHLGRCPQSDPAASRQDDIALRQAFRSLEMCILAWSPDTLESRFLAPKGVETQPMDHRGGLILQRALLILLRVALHGPGRPGGRLLGEVNDLIGNFMACLRRIPLNSLTWTNLLWAILTAGSCLQAAEDREYLRSTMGAQGHKMHTLSSVLQILSWVWEASDSDLTFYGPYGIAKACARHNVQISMG